MTTAAETATARRGTTPHHATMSVNTAAARTDTHRLTPTGSQSPGRGPTPPSAMVKTIETETTTGATDRIAGERED